MRTFDIRLCRSACPRRHAIRGVTLIELVVAISIIGIIASVMLGSFGFLTRNSADPLVLRQSLAIAESMLQEIQAQGTRSTDQSGVADGPGPEAGESRTSGTVPFDHVDDYDGLHMVGFSSYDNAPIVGLESYTVDCTVTAAGVNGLAATTGWWIVVRVTGPDGVAVQIGGWKPALSTS